MCVCVYMRGHIREDSSAYTYTWNAFPSAFVSLNSLGADRAVAHALFADTVDSSKTHVHIPPFYK